MTTTELGINFTKIYEELRAYTLHYFKRYNKIHLDVSWVLSECYIHIDKCKDEITDIATLTAYSKKFIRSNILWTQSQLNTKSKPKANHISPDDIVLSSKQNDYVTSEEYIDKMLFDFYNSLSTYDKGLYNIYFNLNKQKTREIAEHLEVSNTSAYKTLKECRELVIKLKQYINKNIV